MARQFLVPGRGYLNETATRQSLIPGWGYANETQGGSTAEGAGSAAGSSSVSGVGASTSAATGSAAGSATVTGVSPDPGSGVGSAAGGSTASGVGTSSSSNPTFTLSQLIPGWGQLNPTARRQYLIPGRGFVNESPPTGSAGTAAGSSTASGVGASLFQSTGLSSGSSTVTGVALTASSGAGQASGSSTATGISGYTVAQQALYFSPDQLFTYIDLLERATVSAAGSAGGTATATGVGSSIAVGSGAASGSSTVSGVGSTGSVTELNLSAISVSPLVVYSMLRPTGYTGNTFRIERESDSATLDIGFKLNGIADFDAADAFAPSGWRWITQYDLSGNGYHLTVPAALSKPKSLGNMVEGIRSLTFNGPGTNMGLANLSLPVTDIRNMTVMAIVRSSGGGVYEVGNPTRKQTLAGALDSGLNWSGIQGQYLVTSPQVLVAKGNGSSARTLRQNHIITSATAQASSSATGLTLGNGIAYTSPGNGDYLAFVLYNSTLSSTDEELLRDAAYNAVPAIPRECRDVIAVHGDSIVQGNSRGAAVSVETIWFNRLMENTTKPLTWYNCGHGGYTAAQLSAVAATVAAAVYDPSGTFRLIFSAGSNDMAFGADAATTYTNILSAIANWRTVIGSGPNVKVHVIDVLPRKAIFSGGVTAASFETQRQALIPLIAGGVGTYYDSYSSPGTHPVLGDPANCNTTYFVDLVHPNALGNQIYESIINTDTLYMRT